MKTHNKDYFYKYVAADTAKLILKNLKVKYSLPKLFNDPFDNQFVINIDQKDFYKIYKTIYTKLVKEEKIRNINKKQFLKQKTSYEQYYVNCLNLYQNLLNNAVKSIISGNKIFCVSENNDNLLMWAHYADEHKGAVIKLKCLPEKDNLLCAAEKFVIQQMFLV